MEPNCPSAQHGSGIGRMECIFDSTCAGPSCRNQQMDLKADLAHAGMASFGSNAPISPDLSELGKGQTGSKQLTVLVLLVGHFRASNNQSNSPT